PRAPLLPYTTLFRSIRAALQLGALGVELAHVDHQGTQAQQHGTDQHPDQHADHAALVTAEQPQPSPHVPLPVSAHPVIPMTAAPDRKSTRLNSSHQI